MAERSTNIMKICGIIACILFCINFADNVHAARIKDIASIGGVRDNQLIGYGLVVGLNATGDDVKNGFTKETLVNMLNRQGLAIMKDKDIKANNIAAVMVTAKLPPFVKYGTRIDVDISSIGDAKSLQGGMLLMTPLKGADGEIYAIAQGAVTIGGFSASGAAGGGVTKNHTTVGRITNGATVEKELPFEFEKNRVLSINLYQPDFTTSTHLAEVINAAMQSVDAKLIDSSSVTVKIKDNVVMNMVQLVSLVENLDVPVDSVAVVVMNEKTGTVVMGENVRISTVAIAHGNLSIQIKEEKKVSQPLPFAPGPTAGGTPTAQGGVIMAPGGQTVVTPQSQVTVTEEKKQLLVVPKGVTIQEVVRALNAIGVSPRDLITIMQAIKAAGALQADLRII
ncbi:MAG: flagellar basal body P-ring protein FlgI [Deltaproteobacteria bacterium]|nr:flagellar basal body P-ring protein FlgI [Deltaproteobacteria bacterium]